MRVVLSMLSAVLLASAAFAPAVAQRYQESERLEERPRDRDGRREERRERRDQVDEEPRRDRGRGRSRDDDDEIDEPRREGSARGGRLIRSHPRLGGRCLDVQNGVRAGARVQMWDCHGRDNQQVRFNDDEIRVGGLCLEPVGRGEVGSRVVVARCDGDRGQSWSVDRARRGLVQIVSSRGLCLDIQAANPANGAGLLVYDCHDGQNQLFEVE